MTDVIIIGAGILGCSVSLALSRRGYRTLNVDRLPAAGYGSTSYSSAVVRPYYSSTASTMLAYENHFLWKAWGDFAEVPADAERAVYTQCGCLQLKSLENDYLAGAGKVLDEVGVPYTDFRPEDLEKHFPGIELASFAPERRIDDPDFGVANGRRITGALYFPTAGYISDPQLAAYNLQAAAIARGGRFLFNTAITDIRRSGGKVVGVTLDGDKFIDAPIVINVAGPSSSTINKLADVAGGMSVKSRAMRTEVAHVPAPPKLGEFILADGDTGVYLRTSGAGHLLVGSLEPPCDKLDWATEEAYDPSVTDQWTNQVWRAALRFPDIPIPNNAQGFGALYDVTPDWTPIYDKSDLEGFFMAIGTSGNQFKNAPLVGELMANLIDNTKAGVDHDVDSVKMNLPHANRVLDLGFFSRRRTVHPGNSNSVIG